MARKKLKRGGLTKGKSHAKGGMPMVVKSTRQKVELEGGEGVINKHVMADKEKYSFEGRNMTACEIASKLNQETGNGVKFECEETKTTDMTPTDSNTGFAKGGQLYVDSRQYDAEGKIKEIFDKLPPYFEREGTAIYRNTSVSPAYGDLKYADIGNIQRTTIDGKELAIAKIVGEKEYRFVEETFQLKKFPTEKVEWNGNKYNVGKLKKSRRGYSTPLGDYVWYSPIVDKVLKGIASPLFITKYKGYSTDWNIVDGWSGEIGGIIAYKANDSYSYTQKSGVVNKAMKEFHKLISWGFGLPVIIDILKKYNIDESLIDTWAVGQSSQTLIIDAEQAEGQANIADNYGHWKAFKEDKNLYDVDLSPDSTRIFQTIPAINLQFAAFATLDAETYVKLTNEIVDVLMSKDFAALLVMEYDIATLANLTLNTGGILSPSYHFSTKSVATKKNGGKFNRDEAFAEADQQKEIATLKNLMEVFADAPNAVKEMNQAIRRLEQEAELEVNLEGKKNFNLKKAFDSYFNIMEKGYAGKKGNRTKALAPDGERSELTTKQYDITRKSNFLQWFGDWEKAYETKNYNGVSKVVSEDGEPTVVYHGTMPDHDFFKFKFDNSPVAYFAEDEYYSEFFAKKTSKTNQGVMYELFLNIRNPLLLVELGISYLTIKDFVWFLYEKHGIEIDISKCPEHALNVKMRFWQIARGFDRIGLPNLFKTIQKYGYDGIKYMEDNPSWQHKGKDSVTIGWMIFEANKAKLADSRNTTFSSLREDFRFNKGGDVTE